MKNREDKIQNKGENMIKIVYKNGVAEPKIFCDICNKVIKNAMLARAVWPLSEENIKRKATRSLIGSKLNLEPGKRALRLSSFFSTPCLIYQFK